MSVKGRAALERVPVSNEIMTVHLDLGSYEWLLEMVSAKQRSAIWIPEYQRLVKRTLLSLESALSSTEPLPPANVAVAAPRKRVITRPVAKRSRKR